MYTCSKCDFKTETAINYCPECGGTMVYVQPAAQQSAEPTYAPPTYSQPAYTQHSSNTYAPYQDVYTTPTAPKKPHLAFKIVSMALSIGGFVLALVTFFYTLFGLIEPPVAFVFSFIFSIFYSPLSIVGLILSNKCQNAGDNSAFSKVGKILGLIGVIIYGVSLFIGVMSLGAGF